MWIYYTAIVGSIILMGGSALYAIYWAAKGGQFANMENGARVIFDAGEPVGKVTDLFPGLDLEKERARKEAKKKRKI